MFRNIWDAIIRMCVLYRKGKQQIKQASEKMRETVSKKLDDVLNKNYGFKILNI